MRGLIADADFIGILERIVTVCRTEPWLGFWIHLGLEIVDFEALGLHHSSDRVVWERCQSEGLVLITNNRNHEGPDSLEAVIREASVDALPVFTVSDARRVKRDGVYASRVSEDLVHYLVDLQDHPERLLGTGRIFLPKNAD